jgi:hypothetical protein
MTPVFLPQGCGLARYKPGSIFLPGEKNGI